MSGVQYLTGICKHAGSLCLRANDHHHFGDVDTVSQYLVNYSFYRNSMQPPKNFDLVMSTKIPKKFNRNYHSNIFFFDRNSSQYKRTNAVQHCSCLPPLKIPTKTIPIHLLQIPVQKDYVLLCNNINRNVSESH
jgi:hypothetical protein